ncbi:zinc finger protein ZFPM1-like [Amphibalanus amphitrite]|uniref:zinc finger protein ZFPM1-like n=1 Tax=Amphibalanus amphitrite TaxID=1232801 RepID=UPI001C914ACD|nr:zinc finger protein ZFPM1-like [Amphibalanus amphitrite]XP_043206448.1 zinc finger protein ZFPM1-like [Amphibalanus amphitrite]XP_043243645.1 zinc finger protein ZFPM1-like [Amphibalanus amphitrite]
MPRAKSSAGRAPARPLPAPRTDAPRRATTRRSAAAAAASGAGATSRRTPAAAARRQAAVMATTPPNPGRGHAATTSAAAASPPDAAVIDPAALQTMVGDMVRAAVAAALPASEPSPPATVAVQRGPAQRLQDGPAAHLTSADHAYTPAAELQAGPMALPAVLSGAPPTAAGPAPPAHLPAAQLPVAGRPPAPVENAAGDDLAARAAVSPAVAALIVSHQFIDLNTLLNDSIPPAEPGLFCLIDGRLRPSVQRRPIPHFGAWATAFLRYAAVYLAAHPADASGLLRHMQQVSSLQAPGLGFAWRDFDEAFRRARGLCPEAHPWGSTAATSPIWLTAIARGIAGSRAGSAAGVSGEGRGGSSRPAAASGSFRALCLGYNRAAGCRRSPCLFRHECRLCRGPHSVLACPRRAAPALPGTRRPGRE